VRVEDVRGVIVVVRPAPSPPDFIGEEGWASRMLRESEEYRDTFSSLQPLLGVDPESLTNAAKEVVP
jgi:hypothetical protein